jgi:Glycosyl transferase family 2
MALCSPAAGAGSLSLQFRHSPSPPSQHLSRPLTLTPSVSIITTAYNHQRFIGACVESVLAQTYGDWEQIVLDDGSTDSTGDEVRRFSDARVRYVRQEHRGIEALAHSYNHALGFCRAPIIAILEGDDLWSPGKLEQQVPAMDDERIVLAYGEVLDIDADGNIAKSNSRTAERRKKMRAQILRNHPLRSATPHLLTLEGQAFIQPATALLRRSALDGIGGFQFVPGICPPDVPTFIQLSLLGEFAYTPQVLAYRRRHVSSSTLQFLEPMSSSPRDFVFQMLKRDDLGLSVNQRRAIERTWRPRSQMREFVAGRLCLIGGQWKQARSHFVQALGPADPRAAAASAMGWMLSWAHRDLEGVFRIAGRTPLRPPQA